MSRPRFITAGAFLAMASLMGCASTPPAEGTPSPNGGDSVVDAPRHEELPPIQPTGGSSEFRVTTEAYHEHNVEMPVRIVDMPQPAYPESLRPRGVKARVQMTFIVDTLGRAEPASIRRVGDSEPASAASALAESARVAILAGKFRPAGIDGKNVRGWVIHDFEFSPPR